MWTCDLSADYVQDQRGVPDISPDCTTLRLGSRRVRALAADRRSEPREAAQGLSSRCSTSTPAELEACLDARRARGRSATRAARRAQAPTRRARRARTSRCSSTSRRCARASTFEIAVHELGGDVIAYRRTPRSAGASRSPTSPATSSAGSRASSSAPSRQQRARGVRRARRRVCTSINALTDEEHPCQALADCLTLRERWGELRGPHIAFVGDGNNVATSLVQAGADARHVRARRVARGLRAAAAWSPRRRARGARTAPSSRLFRDPREAVAGADAVYTDVWTSMGQEDEAAERGSDRSRPYQVNDALMARAEPARCSCTACRRIAATRSPRSHGRPASVVFDQAENRLHAQKALLVMLFDRQWTWFRGSVGFGVLGEP